MFFLQLLVVFSIFLSTQQRAEKNCGDIVLYYDEPWRYADYRSCTRANFVRILMKNEWCCETYGAETLEILNPLKIIDSSNVTSRHFVSLDIRDTELQYDAETFLPNLEKIIPAPNSTTSVIHIRENAVLCIPKEAREKLLNMVDGRGYIQPCACYVKENDEETIMKGIAGDDCRILYGGIFFVNISNITEKMRKQLETVEELHGFIKIINTTFTSLDFLKNLKKIIFPRIFEPDPAVHIDINPNLTRLGFLLDSIQYEERIATRIHRIMNIRSNPQLRFTPVEKEYYFNFITTEMDHTSPEDPIKLAIRPCKLVEPISKNIKSFENCERVAGNLTIGSSFDGYSMGEMDEIFGSLHRLYGCLTIRGTKLTNLTFLHDLHAVICKDQRPAVIIEDNPELKWLDVQIHEFKDSISPVTVKIKNNPKLCSSEVNYLKKIMNSPWRLIEFDRWDQKCQAASQHSSDWLPYYYAIGAGILVVGMIALEGVVQLVENKRKRRKK